MSATSSVRVSRTCWTFAAALGDPSCDARLGQALGTGLREARDGRVELHQLRIEGLQSLDGHARERQERD